MLTVLLTINFFIAAVIVALERKRTDTAVDIIGLLLFAQVLWPIVIAHAIWYKLKN